MQVVQKDHRPVEIGGEVGETVKGGMKSSGMAFRHLFNTIYSDKHLAIVREIWANAGDAHTARGNPERPFDVVLPTALEPEFRCRDYGTGMDHQMITTRYSTMFDSTKEGSNAEVGMFGIGKFTPFAYTDTYTLTAWDNTERRVYAVYLDGIGCPSITLMSQEPCDEEQGIEISFPVTVKDIQAFRNAAMRVSRGFTVKPKVIRGDVSLPENPIVAKGTNWTLFSHNWSGENGACIRQGTIVYPLTYAPLAHAGLTQLEQQIFSAPFYLDCNIGDVEVSMSRESLSYNETTIENVIKMIRGVVTEIEAQYAAEIAKLTTLYDKNRYARRIANNSVIPQIVRQTVAKLVQHKGKPVDGFLAFTQAQLKAIGGDFHHFGFGSVRKGLRFQSIFEKNGRLYENEKLHRFPQEGLVVMVELLEPGKRLTHPGPRLLEYVRRVNEAMYLATCAGPNRENVANVLWIRTKEIDTPAFQEIMDGLGNISWKLINTLPKPLNIAVRQTVDKNSYDSFGLKRDPMKRTYLNQPGSWNVLRKKVNLNDPDGGIILYMLSERDTMLWRSPDGQHEQKIGDATIQRMMKMLAAYGVLGHRDRVFVVPKARWKLTTGTNWINFMELAYETALSSGVTSQDRTVLSRGDYVDPDLLDIIRNIERVQFRAAKTPLLFKGYWQEILAQKTPQKTAVHKDTKFIVDLLAEMGHDDFLGVIPIPTPLTNHWEEYIKAYPMMIFVGKGNSRHDTDSLHAMADYMNQMDAQAGRPLINEPEVPTTVEGVVLALAA